MSTDPFANQMIAAPLFIGYVIVKAWRPLLADLVCLIVACVLLAVTAWLVTSLERWIGRHVAAYWHRHRTQQASGQLWREFDRTGGDRVDGGVHDGQTQEMPRVARTGQAAAPLSHQLRRRSPAHAIRRRLTRRHSTTSSDRRH